MNGCIAFTSAFFQSLAVEDGDAAALIVNQSGGPQRTCGLGNAGTARAQHLGQELLSQLKSV